ncbi:MAG: hypothetical protein ABIQ56_05310 [Chitinophagaceae bacterium]
MKLSLSIFLLLLISCNNRDTTNKTEKSVSSDTNSISPVGGRDDKFISTTPLTACYAWAVRKDSASLKITYMDDKVTGDLVYDWNEKDGNRGTIKGQLNKNMIVAWYTFQSEGMTSVREVIFKVEGEKLVEGYGEIIAVGDTAKFKQGTSMKFMEDRPFGKVNCN